MPRKNNMDLNDIEPAMSGVTIPENELRKGIFQQQFHFQNPAFGDHDFNSTVSQQPYFSRHQTGSHHAELYGARYGTVDTSSQLSSFSNQYNGHNAVQDFEMDHGYASFGENADFTTAFASLQPCDDCTPSTKTTIPHHHHTSGRLAGTSATLDGHFCCSWLVHGQPCFLCFQSAEGLDNHIKTDHAGKDGTYRCLWQDCSKQDNTTNIAAGPMNFGNKPKLMRHVHSHTGYKPFPCPYPGCDKGFVTKEQLKNHETTHTKSRKYKCDQCDKAFAVKSALTTHITAVHDEKKIHRCDMCGKAFADSSNLSKHKQTHFRDSGVRKSRSVRGASISTSTRSTPSISTPSADPATPALRIPGLHAFTTPPMSPGLMAPPAVPKLSAPIPFCTLPSSSGSMISTTSTMSSPPPESFDPNCYCCEQGCTPPEGPPTPCNEAEDCDLDGFCDLPDCLAQDGYSSATRSPEASMSSYHCNEAILGHHQIEQLRSFQMPQQWDEHMEEDSQQSFSHTELEEQFTNLHGS